MANWGIVTSSPRPHPPYSHSVLPTFHALIECILSLNTVTASLLISPFFLWNKFHLQLFELSQFDSKDLPSVHNLCTFSR